MLVIWINPLFKVSIDESMICNESMILHIFQPYMRIPSVISIVIVTITLSTITDFVGTANGLKKSKIFK